METRSSNRLRDTPPLISRISRPRKKPAVVPIPLTIAAVLSTPLPIALFCLTSASQLFSNDDYWKIAERNLNFVLENQNPDGSWFYAVDGVRDFVDHYHTCFVMKALAKIHALTGHAATLKALGKGVSYYLNNLFDEDGLPKAVLTSAAPDRLQARALRLRRVH